MSVAAAPRGGLNTHNPPFSAVTRNSRSYFLSFLSSLVSSSLSFFSSLAASSSHTSCRLTSSFSRIPQWINYFYIPVSVRSERKRRSQTERKREKRRETTACNRIVLENPRKSSMVVHTHIRTWFLVDITGSFFYELMVN